MKLVCVSCHGTSQKILHSNRSFTQTKNDITLTLNCNNNCIFCPKDYLRPVDCSHNNSSLVLKKLRKRYDSVVLTGGEVTILPSFFKTVSLCKRLGFRNIGIVTNGRMLSNTKFTESMFGVGVNDVTISVYSTSHDVHDSITRTEGSCRQTLDGVRNILSLGRLARIPLKINMVISSLNFDTAYDTLQDLYAMGARRFLLIDPVEMDCNSDFLVPYQEIADFCKKLYSSGMDGAVFCFRGYPQCIFREPPCSKRSVVPAKAATDGGVRIGWEPQNIDTHATESRRTRDEYVSLFLSLFTKIPRCADCDFDKTCPGVQRAYIRRYGFNGAGH